MKKKKYQSGGSLDLMQSLVPQMASSSTFVAPRPLQLPNYRAANLPRLRQISTDANKLANAPATPASTAKIKQLKQQALDLIAMPNPSYQMGGDIVSTMGYRDDSPFNTLPFLNINSPSISMENVSTPLIGISNQTGETKLMKPNKKYKFKNTQSVTEIPAYQNGGVVGLVAGQLAAMGQGIGSLKDRVKSGEFADQNILGKYADIMGALPGGNLIAPVARSVSNLFVGPDKTAVSGSPGQYQTGGDIPLSSNAFQVQGDPNTPDSESYVIGNQPVRLDHKEVVKQSGFDTFVFSEKLKDTDKKSFASKAAAIERKIKTAEKKVASNPGDEFSLNTIEMLNKNLASLAGRQEEMATAKGLRKPTLSLQNGRSVSMFEQYQDGPPSNMPYMKIPQGASDLGMFNHDLYYSPYDQKVYERNPSTGRYKPLEGVNYKPSQEAITQHLSLYPAPTMEQFREEFGKTVPPTWQDAFNDRPQVPQGPVIPQRAPLDTIGDAELLDNLKNNPTDAYLRDEALRRGLLGGSSNAPRARRSTAQSSNTPLPNTDANGPIDPIYPFLFTPLEQLPQRTVSPYRDFANYQPENRPSPNVDVTALGRAATTPTTDAVAYTPQQRSNFTIGDALQGISALSKFGQLIGGPKKERYNLNNTQITQEVFDPSNALMQNQRAFSNERNRLSSSLSPTLSRAVSNSLYAQNLGQANNILTQYQQMNQAARSNYENRLSNQRSENVRYIMATDDINARNRGAYMNTVQNAFDSLSTLGQNLNQKRYAKDALSLLAKSYPDVYKSVTSGL